MILTENNFIRCGSPLGEFELHVTKKDMNSLLIYQKIVNQVGFLDYDSILFALEKERIHSSDPENSHLNLKILQVKKLKLLLTEYLESA